MCLTETISAAPLILSVAQAEARSRFGACGSASANSIEKKSALMHVTERAETVQGKSVNRFIVRSASERFWRNESALFLGTGIRLTNSETPKFICFRK